MSKPRGDSKVASSDVTNNIKREGPGGGKVQQPRIKQQGQNQLRHSGENNLGPPDRKQSAAFIPTRTSSAPPEGHYDVGNFPSHEGFQATKTNAWLNPPHMKDLSAGGSQQIQKDSNSPNMMNNIPIPSTGASSGGGQPGVILIASSAVPVSVPLSPVQIMPNSAAPMPYMAAQPISGAILAIPAVHMGHQGGHDGGDRDNHSYNGPPGSEQQVQGNPKQMNQPMMRQNMQPQSQPQMQPIIYGGNVPIPGGGRPIHGQQHQQQQPPPMIMMPQQMFPGQPYYAPNQPNSQLVFARYQMPMINHQQQQHQHQQQQQRGQMIYPHMEGPGPSQVGPNRGSGGPNNNQGIPQQGQQGAMNMQGPGPGMGHMGGPGAQGMISPMGMMQHQGMSMNMMQQGVQYMPPHFMNPEQNMMYRQQSQVQGYIGGQGMQPHMAMRAPNSQGGPGLQNSMQMQMPPAHVIQNQHSYQGGGQGQGQGQGHSKSNNTISNAPDLQNKSEEPIREAIVPKRKFLNVKDKEGNIMDLSAIKSSNANNSAPSAAANEMKKVVVKVSDTETMAEKKGEEQSKKSTPTQGPKDNAEKQTAAPSVEGSTVSAVEAPVTNGSSPAKTADVSDSSTDAAAEAEAAAAKAAEAKKVELEKIAEAERIVIAKKKAEEEAVLLKQLQDEDRQRIESERKRVALEAEEEDRKKRAAVADEKRAAAESEEKKAAEAEEKRAADELKKVNDDLAKAKIDEDAKKKADAEIEKRRRVADEEEKLAQRDAAAAAAAAAIADTRSKKAKQKDALAAKDAANTADSMLDAYTEPSVGVPIPAPAPALYEPEPKVEVEVEQEPEDDWEASADKPFEAPTPLPAAAPVALARRSLRPGGGLDQQRLNAGFPSASAKPKQQYLKAELLKFRPAQVVEADRPAPLASYTVLLKPRGTGGPPGPGGEAGNSQKSGSGSQGGGGAAWGRGEMKSGQGPQDGSGRPRVPAEGSAAGQHQHGDEGWARSGPLPPLPPLAPRPAKASKGPTGPRPTKVIADPIERLSFDVLSILNKITPQSFEKLTSKMCEIPVGTSAELDKMIELVFEKANLDTSFAHLYAEMCAALEVRSSRWAFLQYVLNKDSKQYIWIKDLTFDNVLAGPFSSVDECIKATMGTEPPVMQHVETKVEVMELNVVHDILIMIFKDTAVPAAQNTETADAYYVSYLPLSEIAPSSMSEKSFDTLAAVQRNAQKSLGFRKRLITACQEEFRSAVCSRTPYDQLEAERLALKDAEGISANDRAQAEAIIDDKHSKLKRRLLSTIRFIGELFKENLLKPTIMYECIDNLIAVTDAEGNFAGFKQVQDEQYIELLCRLLHTMGGKLEMLETSATSTPLRYYFSELERLSKDKKLNSRIRFSLEEVIELRRNKWQSRREEEGPAKLDQIHEKAAAEEAAKQQWSAGGGGHQQQNNRFSSGGQGQGQQQDARGPRNNAGQGQGQGQDRGGFSSSRGDQNQGGYQDQRGGPAQRGQNGQDQNQGRGQNQNRPQQSQQQGQGQGQGQGPQRNYGAQQPSSSSQPAAITEEEIISRANRTVEDYLTVRDATEAQKSIQELPPTAVGAVILKVISKYLNAKQDVQSDLLQLLNALSNILVVAKVEVEAALTRCTELTMLCDTMTDCKKAPEWIGMIVGMLVRLRVCSSKSVNEMVAVMRKYAIGEQTEFDPTEEIVNQEYGVFLAAVERTST